jgi:hypothetical protein
MTRNKFLKKIGLAFVSFMGILSFSYIAWGRECKKPKNTDTAKVSLFENFKRYSIVLKERDKTLPENINRY